MKKLISLGLSVSLLVSACAPKTENNGLPEQEFAVPSNVQLELITLWRELNIGETPNLAVAEIIQRSMSNSTREYLQSQEMPTDKSFLRELTSGKDSLKKHLLFGGTAYQDDGEVIGDTAIAISKLNVTSKSFVQTYDFAYERELQNRAVKSINETFEARSKEIAKAIAPALLKKVLPDDIKKMELASGDEKEKARAILTILKKYDPLLAQYEFPAEEHYKILILGLVAGVIAKEVIENKTLQPLLKASEQIHTTIKLIHEVTALVKIADDSRKKMRADWENMKSSMGGLVKDIGTLKDDLSLSSDTKIELKRLLTDVVHGNLKVTEGDSQSILSEKQKINANLDTFVNSAASAADNLSTILNAANEVTTSLGINLSPEVSNALSTATKVAKTVQLTQKIIAGFAGGGVIGAIGAFAGGGGLASLGIGGGDSTSADLAAIKAELTEIKKLQKEMIKLQIDTMKMIQELAVALQSYHIQEMYLLQEIRLKLNVLEEIAKIESHEKLRNCQMMIEFAMNGSSQNISDGAYTQDILSVPRSLVYSYVTDQKTLERFIRSMGEDVYSQCQYGLNKAFGVRSTDENPLLLALNTDRDALNVYVNQMYRPLINVLEASGIRRSAFGLHLPANSIGTLERKWAYSSSSKNNIGTKTVPYKLDKLISIEALERYVTSLLLVGPVMSFDKKDWTDFFETQKLPYQDGAWERSSTWHANALLLIQSTLAQESILAGEPILKTLAAKFSTILSPNQTACVEEYAYGKVNEQCTYKQNGVLRRNLITYILNKRLSSRFNELSYEKAKAAKDITVMQSILGPEFKERLTIMRNEEGNEVLGVSWNDKSKDLQDELPSLNTIKLGKLYYSGNVGRLINLQQKVVDAMLELKPSFLGTKAQQDFLNTIAIKN